MNISNPAFDYDQSGQQYAAHRQTDPRIAAHIEAALGNARTVLNVGAGAGSYESDHRYVVAVEPSRVMRAQRLQNGRVPALIGTAEHLPFDDQSFDAAMALVTVHHWPDLRKGLAEMRRVTRGPVVIMTFDREALYDFWNYQYFPELIEVERQRYPPLEWIADAMGGSTEIREVPIPLDCLDGFQEAFYGRPEAFLQVQVRRNQSAWGFLPEGKEEELVARLAADLSSGAWEQKYGHYRHQPFFKGALRLIVNG